MSLAITEDAHHIYPLSFPRSYLGAYVDPEIKNHIVRNRFQRPFIQSPSMYPPNAQTKQREEKKERLIH